MKTNLLFYIKLIVIIYVLSITTLEFIDIISFKSFNRLLFPAIIFSLYCIMKKINKKSGNIFVLPDFFIIVNL
ncbi:hypothetical protein UT300005_16050 [Clostridium sp. CTA-5]